jgi:hypothetical protein
MNIHVIFIGHTHNVLSIRTMHFFTDFIYALHMILRLSSEYFLKENGPVRLCKTDIVCVH